MYSNEPRPGDYLSDHPTHSESHSGELRNAWGHPVQGSNGPLTVKDGKIKG